MNKVFALATDTAWGLACDAHRIDLVQEIYRLKGRSFDKPLILFTHSLKEAKELIQIPAYLDTFLNQSWPGDLTLIALAQSTRFQHCHQNTPFLGIRIPNHQSTLKFLEEEISPLAVTSFNLSNRTSAQNKQDLSQVFEDFNPLIIGDMSKTTDESAIIKLEQKQIQILRATPQQICKLQEILPKEIYIKA
ncbi:L-threonylcarbamoyladenylate synthase [bacterium]|nr:L-threonylcarbamoyladenylate synthase [bacterium]